MKRTRYQLPVLRRPPRGRACCVTTSLAMHSCAIGYMQLANRYIPRPRALYSTARPSESQRYVRGVGDAQPTSNCTAFCTTTKATSTPTTEMRPQLSMLRLSNPGTFREVFGSIERGFVATLLLQPICCSKPREHFDQVGPFHAVHSPLMEAEVTLDGRAAICRLFVTCLLDRIFTSTLSLLRCITPKVLLNMFAFLWLTILI